MLTQKTILATGGTGAFGHASASMKLAIAHPGNLEVKELWSRHGIPLELD